MVAPVKLPSRKYLLECFYYDGFKGKLIWRERPQSHFKNKAGWIAFNANWAGKVAGGLTGDGYIQVSLDKRTYKAHRLIFKMLHNIEPVMVDHKDGVRFNNRQSNLRAADATMNSYNAKRGSRNTSGYKGVTFEHGKWRARVRYKNVTKSLGVYNTPEEAHEAYARGLAAIAGEFARIA